MKRRPLPRLGWIALGVFATMTVLAASGTAAPPAVAAQAGSSSFVEVGRCYRFVFAVPGAPDYKVRRVLADGWVEAEVDAGPPSAEREAVYVNLGQVITARIRRCSN